MILDVLTSQKLLHLSWMLAMLGLALAIVADHIQLLAKYHGAIHKRVAGGYNLAMKVMVANRMGAVIYFILIAFNIDNGIEVDKLTTGYSFTIVALSIPTIWLLVRLQKFFDESKIDINIFDRNVWPLKIMVAAFIATSLNIFGLTLPWIAGAANPELRLTLANTSFLFNTLYTMVNVFYIEYSFARLIDAERKEIHGFVTGILIARLFAFLAAGIALWGAT